MAGFCVNKMHIGQTDKMAFRLLC